MKRKWMWAVATLPLVVGFVVAKRLVDKRPRVVARDVDASALIISRDEKRAVTRGNAAEWSHVIDLDDGSQFSIPGDINSHNFFSPDGKKIYQLNTEWEHQGSAKFHDVFVVRDSASGHTEGQYRFASGADLYGIWWDGDEIIAESPRQTWHFKARSLRLVSTQKQHRAQKYAILCPDGQTIYWDHQTDSMGAAPNVWEFADLHTGKIQWSESRFGSGVPLEFSSDGRIVLWSGGVQQSEIIARDTRNGTEQWRLRGPQSDVIALSPDQSAIYEARPNGELWKWPR